LAELANRVNLNDPANAAFYVIPVSAEVAQATGEDLADFAAYITAGGVELTTGGWNRKTLGDGAGLTVTHNTTLNRTEVDAPDQTWTTVTVGNSVALVLCYGSVASPTNAQLEFLTNHTFVITADGSNVVAEISDLFRAA
jgi:hypothetical protein